MNRIRRISTIAAALVLGLAVPATAKLALKTAGEKCKKDGDTAASADGKVLQCVKGAKDKTWTLTAAAVPEKDMPGGKPNPGVIYPERPGQEKDDQEAKIGSPVRLTGRTVWVTSGAVKGKYLVIQVKIVNRDSKPKSYNTLDWKVQTPQGQLLDPTFFAGKTIESGELVNGGTAEGPVRFEVTGKGPFYVVYQGDMFNSARGIWKVG